MADVDNLDEDSSEEFEGLHDRLTAEPVSQDQADARVEALLEKHLQGKTGRIIYQVDESLPPETVIKVNGSVVTLSRDAYTALLRHKHRTKGKRPLEGIRRTGAPYRGS